jgi:hypothetical protein
MLFKHKHLLTELRKNGRRATAEIISIKTVGEDSSIRALWTPAADLEPGWLARNDLHIDEPYGDVPADLTAQNAASVGLAKHPAKGRSEVH